MTVMPLFEIHLRVANKEGHRDHLNPSCGILVIQNKIQDGFGVHNMLLLEMKID